MNCHGFPTIGLSGITCWKDRRSGESEPLPELLEINWKREIYVVFDSDLTLKPEIQSALKSLCKWLAESGGRPCVPRVVQIPCEFGGGKNGADDFIARHGSDAFFRLVRVAQPSGQWCWDGENNQWYFQFQWTPEPTNPHFVATPFWTVFKESYAEHPSFGTYKWLGTHWARMEARKPLVRPIHELMDEHYFHQRGNGKVNSIHDEIAAYITADQWDDPNLVAFANGTLDVKRGILLPGHQQTHRLTFCFPFDFDPQAQCPLWLDFITRTYTKADGSPDPDAVNVLRAAFRWTICPKPPDQPFPYEVAFDVGGPKGCGKGVTSEVLRSLCGGTHGVGTLRSKMFGDPDSLASLLNKKAAIDFDSSGIVTDPGCFNSIVSNEPVQIWIKYKNKCDARLGCVIWRFYNDQPRVADDGGVEGMARRIITFSIPFSVSKKDPHLKHKLTAELPGIYQWAMSMSEAEMAHAFATAGEVESLGAASIDAQLDANPWLQFLIEAFPDGESDIPARDLYERYTAWSHAEGRKPMSNTKFGRKLRRVEGWRQTLRKRSTKHSTRYDIGPLSEVDWAAFFGMKRNGGEFNPPPVEGSDADPPPRDASDCNRSELRVEGMEGLSQPKSKGGETGNKALETKGGENNPPHPPPPPPGTCTERVQAAMKAGCRTEDSILAWCADRKLSLSRSECKRAFNRLQNASSPAVSFADEDDPAWGPRPEVA